MVLRLGPPGSEEEEEEKGVCWPFRGLWKIVAETSAVPAVAETAAST